MNPLVGLKTRAHAVADASRGGLTPVLGGQKTPRERLLTSMIETVGARGYAATTVANVIAHAGASRRTFYQQFTDRQACFLAASDQISGLWIERAGVAVDSAVEAGQDAVEAFIGALFHAALATPAAPRLLVAELAAAGRPGIERRERVFVELAATLRRALAAGTSGKAYTDASHELTETSLVLRALVGAIVRVPYSRTLRGHSVRRPRRGTLLELVPHLAQWAATYRSVSPPALVPSDGPPQVGGRAPGTLSLSSSGSARRGLPRGESTLSRSFVVHSQRERLLDSIANLSAANGYASVTIPDLVTEAAVSVQAFYEHFTGRDDALLVAYEIGHRKALALVERAFEAQDSWPLCVRAAVAMLLDFFASEPSFAHLALIDAPAAGAKVASATREGQAAYIELLKPGLTLGPARTRPPELAAEASAGAVQELCYVYVAAGRTRELSALLELATHVALRPFTAAGASP